ncbi:MAG: nucleotidyltransferase substrate binding protein [Gammaproteobacteria bacterium]|nr:nucleotidyltransferase substrate binding protein [Gammaproteobacteria bacterium]
MKKERWKLRADHYIKAYACLKVAVAKTEYSELEVAGLIHTFAFTFELGWKTLKDLLLLEGFDVATPRATIKQAFQAGHIKNGDIWLDALEKRNLMTHIYDEDESEVVVHLIKGTYYPMLEELHNHFTGLLLK